MTASRSRTRKRRLSYSTPCKFRENELGKPVSKNKGAASRTLEQTVEHSQTPTFLTFSCSAPADE